MPRWIKLRRRQTSSFQSLNLCDTWLTGFNAQCLHTMHSGKPMQGHGLMQAIARVNRVFRDKQDGLGRE